MDRTPDRPYKAAEQEAVGPVALDQLLASAWLGCGRSARAMIMVTLFPSVDHPGYIHFILLGTGGVGRIETKKPIRADGIWLFLGAQLEELGLTATQLNWKPSAAPLPKVEEIGVVYFLRAGPFIKIGRSKTPDARIAELQTACPYPIYLLGSITGGATEENALHHQFAHLRSSGEWFHAKSALTSYIASLLHKGLIDEN